MVGACTYGGSSVNLALDEIAFQAKKVIFFSYFIMKTWVLFEIA